MYPEALHFAYRWFWVAQRFQRCDYGLLSMRASAPEVLKVLFAAA